MAIGFHTVLIRECRSMAIRLGGSRRQAFLNLLAVAVIAAGLPWIMGAEFLRTLVLIPLACLSVFLVADMVADSFSGPAGSTDVSACLCRAAACTIAGWTTGLTTVAGGLVAVNVLHWEGDWQLPPRMILVDAALLSLAASVFVAGAAVCVSRRFGSAHAARLLFKIVMLMATVALMYGCRRSLVTGRILLTNDLVTRVTWTASAFLLANGGALALYGAGMAAKRE
ncbi:MAG TPA: hypothetical protein VL285_17980 [Bryobacteraceae bacterium]|jgi:hypothetical protein|nr:hypothetical protein [Bryobacteraceae bacterium]